MTSVTSNQLMIQINDKNVFHKYTRHRTIEERGKAMRTNFKDAELAKNENHLRMVECAEVYNGYSKEIVDRKEYSNYRKAQYSFKIPYGQYGEIYVHEWDYKHWAAPLDVARATHETMWMGALPFVPPMIGIQACMQEDFHLDKGNEFRKEVQLLRIEREEKGNEDTECISAQEDDMKRLVDRLTEQIEPEWLSID